MPSSGSIPRCGCGSSGGSPTDRRRPRPGAGRRSSPARHTLICAPTGSGKTLAGFLAAIDALYHAHEAGESIEGATRVVYLSPLKALAVDVHTNLEEPLAEIADVARELGYEPAPITVAVRTGDSTSSQRQTMIRRPPNLLVTTPESLYLYLTAERSRATLETVETVIVDEIHALARDKRGSHLTLSLERLQAVTARSAVRIGLSATVRPVETAARLLVGAGEPLPTVVDIPARLSGGALLRRLHARLYLGDEKNGNPIPSPGSITTFVDGAANPVNVEFGPDGNLYYVDFDGGTIRKVEPAPLQPPPSAYLSDLTWTSMTNGFGPVEKDQSNGEFQRVTEGRSP